MGLVNLLLIGF